MIQLYLNYPNSLVSIHGEAGCAEIGKMRKPGQRHVRVDAVSRDTELRRFRAEYRFASQAALNDMWVAVDLDNPQEEVWVITQIKTALGRRYVPFREAVVERHC